MLGRDPGDGEPDGEGRVRVPALGGRAGARRQEAHRPQGTAAPPQFRPDPHQTRREKQSKLGRENPIVAPRLFTLHAKALPTQGALQRSAAQKMEISPLFALCCTVLLLLHCM